MNASRKPASVKPAVVLVSGGMDSAVVLAIAREAGFDVHALSVRYGQRHTSELDAASRVATTLGAVAHKTVTVDLRSIGGSSLTADIDVPTDDDGHVMGVGIPSTYVPARELADWIVAERVPVRFQMQLHKLLWNDEPGR